MMLKKEIIYLIRSYRFWISVGIIIISAVFSMLTSPMIDYSNKAAGTYNLFIFGNIQSNPIMSIIAPFIPAYVIVSSDDLKSGFVETLRERGFNKYLIRRSFSSIIAGGGVYLIALVIIFFGCYIFDPSNSFSEYLPLGLFKETYYNSIELYIFLFIIHSVLFGAIYALFSMSIALITENDSMALVLPGIVYHSAHLVNMIIDKSIISWMGIPLPFLTYEFGTIDMPLWKNILDLSFILVLSGILIFISYYKLRREHLLERKGE